MFQAIFGFFTRSRIYQSAEITDSNSSWFLDRLKWCPTSITALEEAEKKILSYVKKPFAVRYVDILDNNSGDSWRIRTLTMNENDDSLSKKPPLVLLHGLGSAVGLWLLNLDDLSNHRQLYAIDVLGFGLSSRPTFSSDALEVEDQLVSSFESWRKKVGLKKFILLGHSMGGYIATAYAMKYPEKIHHLILAEPWGFPERDKTLPKIQIPLWVKIIGSIMQFFNPLSGLRAAGPWGPKLVEKIRPDILKKFTSVIDDPSDVANYIYHCNAQTPSGESAFKTMSLSFGWAKNPMMPRITLLQTDIPITFLYGARSWMDSQTGHEVEQIRHQSKVTVRLIPGAGHHVNLDQPAIFNTFVQEICEEVEQIIDKTDLQQNYQILKNVQKSDHNSINDSNVENAMNVRAIS